MEVDQNFCAAFAEFRIFVGGNNAWPPCNSLFLEGK